MKCCLFYQKEKKFCLSDFVELWLLYLSGETNVDISLQCVCRLLEESQGCRNETLIYALINF